VSKHSADREIEVRARIAERVALQRCASPRPCPLHRNGARQAVEEVLAAIEDEGWALRKVHATEDQTVEEILSDAELGDLRYPRPERVVRGRVTGRTSATTSKAVRAD